MAVKIRRELPDDAEGIVRYIAQVAGESDFLTFGPGEFKVTPEQERSYLEQMGAQENCLFIIAEDGPEIVGILGFSANTKPRTRHTGEFGMTVRRDRWGKGVGTRLIEYMIAWARESGIVRKINLRVREDNERGIRLYERMGFVREGVITRDFYVDGRFYSSILMGLQVD